MNCVNYKQCKNINLDTKQIYICDRCSNGHCKGCSKITPTEIKCLDLKKERRLRYYCPDCYDSIIEIENVLKLNKQLFDENSILKNSINHPTVDPDISSKLQIFESTLKDMQVTYIQAINETNKSLTIQQDKYHAEIQRLRSEIKTIRDSNIDMVRLLTQSKKESTDISQTPSNNMTNKNFNLTYSNNSNKVSTPEVISYRTAITNNSTISNNDIQNSAKKINSSTSQLASVINRSTKGQSSNDDGFREVRGRRSQLKVGNGEGDKTFHGRKGITNKKIWLFISRVPDSISDKNIKDYIETRTSTTDTYIKKLPTINAGQDNQSFMVGVDPKIQDEVYDSSFWPKKVIYGRFDFKMGRRFLDNPRKPNISSNPQANSFLTRDQSNSQHT